MRQSSKTALGGIVSSLSLALMLATTVFPFLTYALPIISGSLIILIVIEINRKWAFGVYLAVSLLSLLLLADKEAAMMYVAFFGYYPVAKAVIEKRLSGILEYFVKFILFNVSVILAYVLIIYTFTIPIDEMGSLTIPILLGSGNFIFIIYDITLTRTVDAYMKHWRKKFIKLFK